MDNRAPTDEQGTSLIEMLIAAVVVVTLLVAVMSATLNHSRQRRLNSERNLALVAAMNVLEEARTVANTDLPTLDGSGFDVPGPNGGAGGLRPLAGDADSLPGELTVQQVYLISGIPFYRVTAKVEWRGVQNRSEIELSSFVAERKQ